MATLNGSPIQVDELPSIYALLSADDLYKEARVYEIFLTLDQEIQFIWRRSWKPSTVLYIFVRYFGTVYNVFSTACMSVNFYLYLQC
ncbi:hypothetical protein V8B97DRAFT_11101 [Scleroderma yunnanense]